MLRGPAVLGNITAEGVCNSFTRHKKTATVASKKRGAMEGQRMLLLQGRQLSVLCTINEQACKPLKEADRPRFLPCEQPSALFRRLGGGRGW